MLEYTPSNSLSSTAADAENPYVTRTTQRAIWFLVGRTAENESVRHIPLHSSPFLIGRRADASLCLASQAVSSRHAELSDDGEKLTLRDLGSTNGTFRNGERVWDCVEVQPDDLIQFADVPFRLQRQLSTSNGETACTNQMDYAMALVQLDKLMTQRVVTPHYQPIVALSGQHVVGYEVLARSTIPGLEMPASMFTAAAQLNLEVQLSQMIRSLAIEQSIGVSRPTHLFLNTHPNEIQDATFVESIREIRRANPAQEITLEIHEQLNIEISTLKQLRDQLRDINVGIAYDDFGVGRARIAALGEVHPDFVKFDISLIRGIDRAPAENQKMVASLVKLIRDMGISTLAEGVETVDEKEFCAEIGFEYGQGFLFGTH